MQAAKHKTLFLAAMLILGIQPLAAHTHVAKNSRPGLDTFKTSLHQEIELRSSLKALEIDASVRRTRVRSRSSGRERDAETGLDYFLVRYYSSAQGRFTRPDPANAGRKFSDPQSWNGYAYARNNPLKYVDPFGTDYRVCDGDGKNCRNLSDKQYDQYLSSIKGTNTYVTPGGTINYQNDNGSVTKVGSASWFDGAAAQRANNAVGFLNFAVLTMSSNMAGEFLGAFAIGPLLGRAAPVVANLLGRGGTQESVALFRAVSEAEFEQVLKTGAFEAGPNSLGGEWFAESAADAAKWGDRLQGPGNFRILRTELPKDAADSLMRMERLDSIGPARYGELNQINVPGMKVGGLQ